MSDLGQEGTAPYLSIVCAFGNAQRGDAWLRQTRAFLAATAFEARRSTLPIEILLVDRDSSGEGGPAQSLLGPLPENEFLTIRIVTVPGGEIIQGQPIDRERRLQNIGIRRARGDFILAARTDIVLSAELVRHLASRPLREHAIYHAMRIETEPDYLAGSEIAAVAVESACRRGAVVATLPPYVAAIDGPSSAASDSSWVDALGRAAAELRLERFPFPIIFSLENFVLMGRRSWHEIGGFPEWNVSESYFDRIVLAQARHRGWPATIFPGSCPYFSVPSLSRPDAARDIYVDTDGDLRIRIAPPPIRNLNNWQTANLLNVMHRSLPLPPAGPWTTIAVNDSSWGLADFDLPEIRTPTASTAPIPTAEDRRNG